MSYKGTYNGKTLKHYRTKGSRNGYSKDPNYTPIGEIAKGVNSIFERAKRRQNSVADTAPGLQVVAKTGSQLNQRTQNTAPGLNVARDVENFNQRTQNTAPGLNVARKTPITRQSFPRTDKTIGRRNTDTNANYTARAQEASARAGQANAIRSNQKAAEQRRIAGADGTNRAQLERMLKEHARVVEENRRAEQMTAEQRRAAPRRDATSARPIDMEAFRRATGRSSQAARDAETKRQNLRTGESQVMANRRHPVSDARNVQGSANSARAAVENRRTAESKKAHYQRKLEKSKKVSSARNSRSDIQNAVADAKSDAKRLIKKGRKKVRNLLRKFF